MATTFEEAKLCPRCGLPGEDVSTSPTKKPGVTVHNIKCLNELCTWYNTFWLVQVNADGSVPPPNRSNDQKLFRHDPEAERIAEQIHKSLDAQVAAETKPGGHAEIINPYSSR